MAVNVPPKNLATLSPTLFNFAISQLRASIILLTPQTAVCTIVENTSLSVSLKPPAAALERPNTATSVINAPTNIGIGFAIMIALRIAVAPLNASVATFATPIATALAIFAVLIAIITACVVIAIALKAPNARPTAPIAPPKITLAAVTKVVRTVNKASIVL